MREGKKGFFENTSEAFKKFFNNLFCVSKEEEPKKIRNRKAAKSKQFVQLALLGKPQLVSLCKMTRKNFIGTSKELSSRKLPTSVWKYLTERISCSTIVTKGQIGQRFLVNMPSPIKLQNQLHLSQKYGKNWLYKIQDVQFIYRLRHQLQTPLCLLNKQQNIGQQLKQLTAKFTNSIFILPPQTPLDQIGITFCDTNKLIEIQSIVVNGKLMYYFVYVGNQQLIKLTEDDQIDFIIEELAKNQDQNNSVIEDIVRTVYKKSSLKQLLSLLKKSISESKTDNLLSRFIKNTEVKEYISDEKIKQLLIVKEQQKQTPLFRHTAKFNAEILVESRVVQQSVDKLDEYQIFEYRQTFAAPTKSQQQQTQSIGSQEQ